MPRRAGAALMAVKIADFFHGAALRGREPVPAIAAPPRRLP
jgi:hypothetical protein